MEKVEISAFELNSIIDKIMDDLTVEERLGIDLLRGDDDCRKLALEIINSMSGENFCQLDLDWWCLYNKWKTEKPRIA